ncbi:MAG: T9SS type A sorting domain-containing protein [Saprospiraceae bacterium]|nr:T9SS type A sorting domain-containing protein [Saprospiraceae bacterium]
MKIILMFVMVFVISIVHGQSLPIDFEMSPITSDFIDFDGGKATVIQNPHPTGINPSNKVAQIVRKDGQVWAGSKLVLKDNLDFKSNTILSLKVFTTAPIGTTVKFKLEGVGSTERDVVTKLTNEWETLTWDFTGEPKTFNNLVFMFDFGKLGNGSEASTFLFDDIEQLYGGEQIDLPVNFEGSVVNYTMTDFGGNKSSLVEDPTNNNNKVIKVVKTKEAATWAGTTIGTPAGFANNIPLTLTNSKMNVMVWSPDAGIFIRLKVEDSKDVTHTCETQTKTKLAGKWENIEFDFKNQAPGTELLSVGLSKGWKYNEAAIFFNFGKEGDEAGEKTYYFDDVKFGAAISGLKEVDELTGITVYPNPSEFQWSISSENERISKMEIFDVSGRILKSGFVNDYHLNIDAQNFSSGIYILKLTTAKGIGSFKILK